MTSHEDLVKHIGDPTDVLGPIPSPQELKRQLGEIEQEMTKEQAETERLAEQMKKRAGSSAAKDVPEPTEGGGGGS